MELLAGSLNALLPYHTALFPGDAINWPLLTCKVLGPLFFSKKSSVGVYGCAFGNKWHVGPSANEEGLRVIQSVLLPANFKLHVTMLCHLPSYFTISFRERPPEIPEREKRSLMLPCFQSALHLTPNPFSPVPYG